MIDPSYERGVRTTGSDFVNLSREQNSSIRSIKNEGTNGAFSWRRNHFINLLLLL